MNARHCKRGKETFLASGIATALFLCCSLAHAQAWLPDRDYTEGPGIKAGQFELHPGLAARAGYDSNVFSSDGSRTRGFKDVGSGIIAITPHINISTRGRQRQEEGEAGTVTAPPKVRLKSGLAGTFFAYTADDTPSSNVGVDVDAALEVMPERVVSGEFDVSYRRTIRPFTEQGASNYVRDNISPGAKLKFQSRGGVLMGSVGYQPQFDFFKSSAFDYLNNFTHVIPMSAGWKFLPHTALLYDGQLAFRDYRNQVADAPNASVLYTDSTAFRSRVGINGALTNNLQLRLMAGGAFSFYDSVKLRNGGSFQFDEVQQPIGEASLTWTFGGRKSSLRAGYKHDVQTSYVGAWVQYDRGEIALALNLLSVLALRFEVGGGRYDYGNMVGPDAAGGVRPLGRGGQETRHDLRLDAAVRAEYRVTNWLAFMADATVIVDDTDFVYDAGLTVDPANYTKFQVFGGVRAHY